MNEQQIRKINKFELKPRLTELNIDESLKIAGLKNDSTLLDIGSGTGVLVFEANKITKEKIYSLEMSEMMIDIQNERIKERKIKNIEIIKQNADGKILDLKNDLCDMVTMITVFHEIDDKMNISKQINRILKPNGKVMIIEFHKRDTEFGPPLDERLNEEEVEEIFTKFNFEKVSSTILGDNFYRIIFQKKV